MQGAGDIGRGDNNTVGGLAVVKLGMEATLALPLGIPSFFNIMRFVSFGEGTIDRHRFILVEDLSIDGE
jgi:hypothetical protein